MNPADEALADRWLIDRDLSAEEERDLRRLLAGPDGAGLRERLVLACLLGQALDPTPPEAFAAGVARRLRAAHANDVVHRASPRTAPTARRWPRVAAAAVLLLAVAGLLWATVLRVIDPCLLLAGAGEVAVVRAGAPLATSGGMALRPGDRLRTTGPAAIGWADGTRLDLAAGTGLDIGQDRRLRLQAGSLAAMVMPQQAGTHLAVATPDAIAEVVGTRFTLGWDGVRTRLAVAAGSVRLAVGERAVTVSSGGVAESDPVDGLVDWLQAADPTAWTGESGTWTWKDGVAHGDTGDQRARLVSRTAAGDLDLACRIRISGAVTQAEIQAFSYAWFATLPRRSGWSELRLRRRGTTVACTLDGQPLTVQKGDQAADPLSPLAFYIAVGGRIEIADLRLRTP